MSNVEMKRNEAQRAAPLLLNHRHCRTYEAFGNAHKASCQLRKKVDSSLRAGQTPPLVWLGADHIHSKDAPSCALSDIWNSAERKG